MNAQQNKTALANYALSKIGGKIFNFGDGTTSDIVMSAIYDQCRRYCLEQCPWSFAVQTLALTQLNATLTVFGDNAEIAYALPDNFLKPYLINFPYALTRFEVLNTAQGVSGNTYALLSDTSGLIVKYVFDNDDPTMYSSKFYEYLALKLAREACFKLVEAVKYASVIKGEMESAFLEAAAEDGQISSPDQIEQNEWDFSRLAGSSGFVYYPSGNIGFYPWYPVSP
jgi:hypothetical protein